MAKSDTRNIIILISASLIVIVAVLGFTGLIGDGLPFDISFNDFRNTTPLSISDAVPIDCDVSNFMVVRYTDGTEQLVYTGRDGFIPNSFIQQNSLLDRTSGANQGNEIELVKIQLALECGGSIMRQGSATVSGTNQASLCTYVSSHEKECLVINSGGVIGGKLPIFTPHPANDGSFCTDPSTIINNVCILSKKDGLQAISIPSTTINDRQIKVIQETILTTDDIFRLYGDPPPSRSIASTFYPQINFVFANGQRLSYDGLAENDRTTTSWQGWTYVETPVDTDLDGITDLNDTCPDEPETVNGFQDSDGCPDVIPVLDSDGDGVLDSLDQCDGTPIDADIDSVGCPIDDPIVCPQGLEPNSDGTCPDAFAGLTDSDGDGVNDAEDICPTTDAGEDVDSDGCILPALASTLPTSSDVGVCEFVPLCSGSTVARDYPDCDCVTIQLESPEDDDAPQTPMDLPPSDDIPSDDTPVSIEDIPQLFTRTSGTVTPEGDITRNDIIIILIIGGVIGAIVLGVFAKRK